MLRRLLLSSSSASSLTPPFHHQLMSSISRLHTRNSITLSECKEYLREQGLRLTGNKETLLQRMKEHKELLKGGVKKKYPESSFVLDCTGDACTGDVVMFEQNVFKSYNILARCANGPPLGKRIVVGRIVKESYGAAKQQQTFTIEVLWSRGRNRLPPLHPLRIKARNLYRSYTLRQKWEDEEERQKVIMEKHSRGYLARRARESRIVNKHIRNAFRENKGLKKESNKNHHSQTQNMNAAKHTIEASKPLKHPHVNENPDKTLNKWFPERFHNMQPLRSMNNHHLVISLIRKGYKQHKQCKFYARGRCSYGDNCKFMHN